MKLNDLHWLAGLLEGEGNFGRKHNRRADGPGYSYPLIQVEMTDRDIIERARLMLGARNVYERKPQSEKHKTKWQTRISGAAAFGWMLTLYPLMGDRRRCQIRAAILNYLSRKRGQPRGEQHHATHLTILDVREIRRLYGTGRITQATLGRIFKMSGSGIAYVIHGKNWKERAWRDAR